MSLSSTHTCRTCDAAIYDAKLSSLCPACGVRIGAETLTVRESKPAATLLLIVGAVLFVIAIRETPFGRWEAHQILALGLCVLVTWLFITRAPNEAVLWRSAVVLLEKGAPPRQIAWEGVERLSANHEASRIEFLNTEEAIIECISIEFFGTWRRAERFIRESAEYLGDSNCA